MNKHFYRVIFNKALGLWQCVSELAKTAGKSKSLKAVVVATTLAMSANVMAYDVTYNDGKTHSAGEFTYVQGFMHITEPNTKISAEKQVIFGSTPESTGIPNNNVLISNQAEAISQDIIIGAKNPSKVQLDNAKITAYNTFVIGGNAQAELTASNASNITVNNMTVLSDQANGKSTFTLTDKDTTLSTQTLHVGVSDVANMTIKNKAHVRTDNVTISALQEGTGSSMTMDNGSMQVNDTIRVGMNGTGTLDILNGGLIQGNKMSIGDKENAVGIINISKTNHDNESRSSLILSEVLRIGNSGTGHINLSNGEISSPEIIIGWDTNSKGSLTITDNDRANQTVSLSTNDLIIGYQGQGEMSIQNLSYNDYVGTLGNAKRVTLGDKVGSHGTLTIKEAGLFIQPREQNTSYLTIGNEGTGVLNLLEQGDIDVTQIRREKTGQAIVNINGGQITVRQDQNNLFENFDETTPINIGENGVIFHTGEVTDNYVIVNNNTVTINKNAILTGNTGSLNFDKTFIDGSFIKQGVGTLILDENNKKFTGDLSIFHGLLKINGNYTMNGENLTIGIIDQNDNQSINTTDEYGKLEVTGTADISSGHLQVLADDIAKILITKDNPTEEFKDIVKAGTLKGRFKGVSVVNAEDGTPIDTTLTADYRDEKDGRIHLSFNPQNPSTGNPSTGNPSTGNPSTGNPSTGNPSTGNPSTGNPSTGNPSTGNPSTGNPSTGNPSTTKSINRKSINRKSINRKSINRKSINRKSINRKSINRKSINRKSINRKSINRKSINRKSINRKSINRKSINRKSINRKSINRKSINRKS
ncbi:ESPR-type extended signal peptide-containing protein [Moraxella sp. ZY210820]|uniref:ESPR-type extended signal peptide-containing protein n=1 Tax=Moraxella sp. ZY210820 TaxID=2904123 RepID=UPI0027310C24|nr:ESPR-type extended signal peptide-containing protein [Moraxella sp. ZY210820]WLF82922.1 hypothetical protein LU301_06410 [Moraxella sp. ZY210820]